MFERIKRLDHIEFEKTMVPTSLQDLIADGDFAGVRSAVAGGAEVNQKNADGMDLLSHSLDHQRFEIAEFLLSSGADINGNGTIYTPLQAAIDNGAYDLIFKLIDLGAIVNLKGSEEAKYPLHQLAWGYLEPIFFERMITAGADLTLTDGDGYTAFDIMLENLDNDTGNQQAINEILELLSPGERGNVN